MFDSHFHVVDPRFPLTGAYRPEPFTVEDWRAATAGLGITGGAVVSGSFQGFDQTYLLDALGRLGSGFAGVTQLPATVADEEIRRLDAAGVRAVRFNLRRGGSAPAADLERLGRRVHDLAGWHVELYADACDLADHEPVLARLPRVSIDHLGLSREGLGTLLRLVERGVRVKATGFGRVALDVGAALRAIAAVDPGALLFGTDLPGTRARRPFAPTDVDLVVEAVGPETAERVLEGNARAWYRV